MPDEDYYDRAGPRMEQEIAALTATVAELESDLAVAYKWLCPHCVDPRIPTAIRENDGEWAHVQERNRWYCIASPIRERRYRRLNKEPDAED